MFARVKVPELLDRYVVIEYSARTTRLIPIEEVIGAHLDRLFPGRTPLGWHMFRVTRNADYDVEGVDVEDLLETVASELQERRFGKALRLEVDEHMPDAVRNLLVEQLELHRDEVVACQAVEDVEYAGGGRRCAAAVFGVERQFGQTVVGHGLADVAFDEGLDEHGDEVAAQQRFDPCRIAEEHRGDQLSAFELAVALLQVGLKLVCGE